ncbi:MAG: RsmE family RNA methyltransferase, partial [Holosporales bacterium]|nr:RsmE family RNA methyltransferase [Holosporales bacterium]
MFEGAEWVTGSCGFIIGPEGGFSDDEKALLLANTTAVTLSENILRSETAAIACLAA